ncbi:hypothetical protein CgunFtcFv8_013242 [Champsocephalus gunnari]|uniref:Uncharacterized protein n=1 Tax=Champsocephalus gunnari TaxID=52237 RepID=A0AAN8DT03_CHAGU|nr:hypothetical protein CgunFtcFv8_013242 [Champsocephalus gunnari]
MTALTFTINVAIIEYTSCDPVDVSLCGLCFLMMDYWWLTPASPLLSSCRQTGLRDTQMTREEWPARKLILISCWSTWLPLLRPWCLQDLIKG